MVNKGWKGESKRHSIAAKKNRKKSVRINAANIGDGKLPNKYWVSVSNDFLICKKGVCDWASDSKKFKVTGKMVESFNTYNKALHYINDEVLFNDEPKKTGVNFAYIEDRISGEVFSYGYHSYSSKNDFFKSVEFELESREDYGFTKDEMAKKGVKFE